MNGRTGELSYKPRPTRYGDVVFRSRLEARWAQIFDLLEIEWAYEPAGYLLDASWCPRLLCCGPEYTEDRAYLPDFYLPQSRMWVEVKGAEKNLRRGLVAWATSCLPKRIGQPDPPEWTTQRQKAAWNYYGYGGNLLLLGPVPVRDRSFTLLSSRGPWEWSEPDAGDVYAYRVRLDSLGPSPQDCFYDRPDAWEPWNYVLPPSPEIHVPYKCRAPACPYCELTNKVVGMAHGFNDGRPAGPGFATTAFDQPWLDAVDEEPVAWSSVDLALKIARESQHQFEDAQFVEGRRRPLISAPRCAVDTSREDDDVRDWQFLADAGAFNQ